MGKYDVQRIKPPTAFILHHSVSPEGDVYRKWTDEQWKNWYNNVGRTRTYAGYTNSEHYDPITKQETFSAVPITLVPNGDGSDLFHDTWRMVEMFDWYNCIGWQCGNWNMNCKSVGMETYGTWLDKELPINACKCIAKWIRENIDPTNGGITQVLGHKEIYATACPGRILERRDLIIDMANNPQKYDNLTQLKEEDPKMIEELKSQIAVKDQQLLASQALVTEKTTELEATKAELIDFRKKTSDEFFKSQQELVAQKQLNADLQSKFNKMNDDDTIEDNESTAKINELQKKLDEALKVNLAGQSISSTITTTTTAPIVTTSVGNLIDKGNAVQSIIDFLKTHTGLLAKGGVYSSAIIVVMTLGDLILQLFSIQVPTQWTTETIASAVGSGFIISYGVWIKNHDRIQVLFTKKPEVITDVPKIN